jgi:uroporphyrinogen-III synthase
MSVDAPLSGVRVVVTRPVEVADRLTAVLRAAGAEVVEVPFIEVLEPADGGRALRDALGRLSSFEWLVVTSVNGAVRCSGALVRCAPGAPFVAAVGPATALALGRPVDLVPLRHDAEGLLEMMPPLGAGGKVLVAQADRARPVLAAGLAERGWVVETVVAYRTVDRVPPPTELDRAAGADVVVFASGSAAEAWVASMGDRSGPAVVSIGPVTTAAARRSGLSVVAEAVERTPEALCSAVEEAVRGAGIGPDDGR